MPKQTQTEIDSAGLDRRAFLKTTVATATIGAISIPASVAATDSGEVELETSATIYDSANSAIEITVREFETSSDDTPLNTHLENVNDGTQTHVLDTLEANSDYHYEYFLEMGANSGTDSPEFDTNAVALTLPEESIDWEYTNYTTEEGWRGKPDHVTIEFDEQMLYRYEPLLVTDWETRQRHNGLFGYVARSEEYDYDVCCYWSQLSHQDGANLWGFVFQADSHLGDHEPIYVMVDKETGEVARVVYSAYHHFPAEVEPMGGNLEQIRHPELRTHATLEIIPYWHHHKYSPGEDGAFASNFSNLEDWGEAREQWADNGFYNRTNSRAIEDPEVMLTRSSWWESGTIDHRLGELFHRLGWAGGSETDDLR
ncbi:hypothetical protein ACFQO4_20555 [Saliphagus sp. GCM10025334]